MNYKKPIFSIALLVILTSLTLFPPSSTSATPTETLQVTTDNFNNQTLDPAWRSIPVPAFEKQLQSGPSYGEYINHNNSRLEAVINGSFSTWGYAQMVRSINQTTITGVSIDLSYNFYDMGEIIVQGLNSKQQASIWFVRLHDGSQNNPSSSLTIDVFSDTGSQTTVYAPNFSTAPSSANVTLSVTFSQQQVNFNITGDWSFNASTTISNGEMGHWDEFVLQIGVEHVYVKPGFYIRFDNYKETNRVLENQPSSNVSTSTETQSNETTSSVSQLISSRMSTLPFNTIFVFVGMSVVALYMKRYRSPKNT